MSEFERLYENILRLVENNGLELIKVIGEENPEQQTLEELNDLIEEQLSSASES